MVLSLLKYKIIIKKKRIVLLALVIVLVQKFRHPTLQGHDFLTQLFTSCKNYWSIDWSIDWFLLSQPLPYMCMKYISNKIWIKYHQLQLRIGGIFVRCAKVLTPCTLFAARRSFGWPRKWQISPVSRIVTCLIRLMSQEWVVFLSVPLVSVSNLALVKNGCRTPESSAQ